MESGRRTSSITVLGVILLSILAGVRAVTPRGVTVIDDITRGQRCERARYYCAKGCEPSDPGAPSSPLPPGGPLPDDLRPMEEYPEYPTWGPYAEFLSTSVSPVTLYENEDNDISAGMYMQFDTPFTVEGDDLWQVSTWFSNYRDGSGSERKNLREDVLTRRQRDKPLRPERKFTFQDLDQNADLSGGDTCDDYKYFCSEISQASSPNPGYGFIKRRRGSTRGCTKVTCKERGSTEPNTVQFDSVKPSGVELYTGEKNQVTADVAVTFNEANTNPDVAGEDLWQMSTWFSKDEDGEGRATGLAKWALSDEHASRAIGGDLSSPMNFENIPVTADLRDADGCRKYKYFCAQVRKGDPKPDYRLVGKTWAGRTGCSPVSCRSRDPQDGDRDPSEPGDRDREPGDRDRDPGDRDRDRGDRDRNRVFPPERKESAIEVVSTSTTPVTLYLNEVNDVTTDVDIVFDTDVYIQGTDLWEMSIWFSKQRDGSGRQTNLREAVLSPRQRNKKVKPEKALTYVDLPQSVDLTDGSGCGKFRYICSEIRKNNPNPDFKLTDRYKLSRRGCAQVTCKERGDDSSYPTVQFAAVQPSPVTIYAGEKTAVNTDVDVKFKEPTTNPDTAGVNLWQMSLWFSKQADGSGKVTDYVETTLSEAQGEMGVDFDNFVMEGLPITADLRNLLGCGKHKYLCARVRKDSPEPDYELLGKSLSARTGCVRVKCETRSPDGRKLEIVATSPTPVTIYKNERNRVTTDVTVDFDADYGVSGRKLWQMSLWFSKSPVGDGKKYNFEESVLSGLQRSTPINIEESLMFENLPQSVDLTKGVGCGKFKYICAEIRKLEPEPPFEYTLKKASSPKGCAKVTCIDRGKSTPTVEFQSVQPTPVTLTIGENNRVTTDVTVEFNPETTDDDVEGKGLWGMALWFSKSKDGVGSSTGFVESTLSSAQKKQPVAFGGNFEFVGLETSVDLRNALGCGKYRFICARIRKGDPQPDYTLVGRKSVTGCAPVRCQKAREEPLVIVSTSITPVTLYIGEVINVFPDVTVQFEGENGVSGSDLWEMSIWFNKNADGSGKKYDPAESTLSAEQRSQDLDITQDLVFRDIEKSVDLTVVEGCGKFKYICAEIRKSNPSPPFDYEKKKPSSVRGCAKTSCEVREEPTPTVKFQSTQPTGVTIYEEELNVVNTDVVVNFDEAETDPTVAGERLWQMQLWFSKAADGQGSSIGTIESALDGEQGNQPVSFTDFSFQALEARADLTVTGCGKYQYLCARVRRDKPDPNYKLVGKDPSQTTGCAPVECLRGRDPTVQFRSVTNTPVTVYEDTRTPVTTTVTVTFEEDRTDQVSGQNLWQVDLWFSKSSDGLGSSSDGVTSVLSAAQAAKPVNFRNFVFEDLEITADLTPETQGCGKYRFICAQIRRDDPVPTYKRLGKERETTVGCSPVRCDKSQVPTVEFASISVTPVEVYEERATTVTTTVSAAFNRQNTDPNVAGTGLWQVRLWFSKAADGQGSSSDEVESALTGAQGSKAVNFNNFAFEDLEITADLTATGCGKYRFICAQIRRDDPEPDFELLGKSLESTSGCAPVTCDSAPTPHITPTSLSVTPRRPRAGRTFVETGSRNTIDLVDITIRFDASDTDDVSGSNLWKVIVWLSDDGGGIVGSRIAETEETITRAQRDQSLASPGPLRFQNVQVDMDLRKVKCKYISFVCARMKRDSPDPDYTMSPKSVTGCAPITCG